MFLGTKIILVNFVLSRSGVISSAKSRTPKSYKDFEITRNISLQEADISFSLACFEHSDLRKAYFQRH